MSRYSEMMKNVNEGLDKILNGEDVSDTSYEAYGARQRAASNFINVYTLSVLGDISDELEGIRVELRRIREKKGDDRK